MEHVTSDDGTRIGYEREGEGPPLVLVHGTAADHRAWDRVRSALAEHFTVYAMDRRGRGGSEDADEYAIEREFEDIAAVANAIDDPVNLLGHSFGGVCSVGAVPLIDDLRRLVLYEPPLLERGLEDGDPEVIERMEELAARGEDEAVLEAFYCDLVGMDSLEPIRSHPTWEMRVAAAPVLPRELPVVGSYYPDADRFADLSVPTLLLFGSDSNRGLESVADGVRDLLPETTVKTIEGAGHAGMHTHPEEFSSTVIEFLQEDSVEAR